MLSFPDGLVKECLGNSTSENVLARVDSYAFSVILLEANADYHKDNAAVDIDNKCVITSKARKRLRMTTQGHKMKVLRVDGTKSWTPLILLRSLGLQKLETYSRIIPSVGRFRRY